MTEWYGTSATVPYGLVEGGIGRDALSRCLRVALRDCSKPETADCEGAPCYAWFYSDPALRSDHAEIRKSTPFLGNGLVAGSYWRDTWAVAPTLSLVHQRARSSSRTATGNPASARDQASTRPPPTRIDVRDGTSGQRLVQGDRTRFLRLLDHHHDQKVSLHRCLSSRYWWYRCDGTDRGHDRKLFVPDSSPVTHFRHLGLEPQRSQGSRI